MNRKFNKLIFKSIIIFMLIVFCIIETNSQDKMGFGINRNQLHNGYGLASNLFGLESLDLKSFFDNSNMDTMLYYNDRCFSPDCRYYYIKSVDSLKFYFSRNNKLLIAEKCKEFYTINWNKDLLVFSAEIADQLFVLYRVSLQNDTIHYYNEPFCYVNIWGEINNRFAYDFRTNISDNSNNLHRDNLIIADEYRLLLFPKDSILSKLDDYNRLFNLNFNIDDILYYTDDVKFFRKWDTILNDNGYSKLLKQGIIFKDSIYYNILPIYSIKSTSAFYFYKNTLFTILSNVNVNNKDEMQYSLVSFDEDTLKKTFTITFPRYSFTNITKYLIFNNYLILQISNPDYSLCYNSESYKYMDYCVLFFDLEKSEFVKTPIIKIVE